MINVTVVIPLYNKSPYIRRSVNSVIAQTYRHFELIVVDDGSTDKSGQIVESINDARIRLITQKNAGEGAARNTGIKAAKNDLIAFLDADDRYNPDFLAVILNLVEKYGATGVYGTSYEIVEKTGQRISWRVPSLRRAGAEDVLIQNYFQEALLGPRVVCSSAVAIYRKIFDEVGFFPEGVQLGGDLDMWMRIGARYPIAVSSYIGAVYHRDAANRADTGRPTGNEFLELNWGLRLLSTVQLGKERERYLYEYVCKYQIRMAAELILLGQNVKAREILSQCKTKRFFIVKFWWYFLALVPIPITNICCQIRRILIKQIKRIQPWNRIEL